MENTTPERPAGSLTREYFDELLRVYIQPYFLGRQFQYTKHVVRLFSSPVGKALEGDRGVVISVSVSSNDTMVVTARANGRVRLWRKMDGASVGASWDSGGEVVSSIVLTLDHTNSREWK
jgi:hypothetical protein